MNTEMNGKTILKLLCDDGILAPGVDPGEDDDLLECGLDSMAMMQMMVAVENQFGVVLTAEDLTLEHVRTARSLAARIAFRAPANRIHCHAE